MKRLLLLSAAGMAALALSGSASAVDGDMAAGGGKSLNDIFNLSAHSGPLGQDARGHMHAKNTRMFEGTPGFDFEFDGTVRCLRVLGNLAVVGGRTNELEVLGAPNLNEQNFRGFTFYVEDRSQLGLPDEISFEFVFPLEQTVCPVPNPFTPMFPLTNGNVVVRDALL
jgi:hypothetical protein